MYNTPKESSVHTLKNTAQSIKEDARDAAYAAQDEVREAAHRAGRKVRNLVDTAGDEITHATEAMTTRIRTKPVQSSLIALGAGVILGMLFRR